MKPDSFLIRPLVNPTACVINQCDLFHRVHIFHCVHFHFNLLIYGAYSIRRYMAYPTNLSPINAHTQQVTCSGIVFRAMHDPLKYSFIQFLMSPVIEPAKFFCMRGTVKQASKSSLDKRSRDPLFASTSKAYSYNAFPMFMSWIQF